MRFTLSNIPMPPSSNHQYFATAFMMNGKPMGKIAPSRDLKKYVEVFGEWAKENNVAVAKARAFIRDEILFKSKVIGIDTHACFPGTSLWTQKGDAKKMDATNRLKALHDCLGDALQVDDSLFWEGRFAKRESAKAHPWCFVEIYPVEPLSVAEWQTRRSEIA